MLKKVKLQACLPTGKTQRLSRKEEEWKEAQSSKKEFFSWRIVSKASHPISASTSKKELLLFTAWVNDERRT